MTVPMYLLDVKVGNCLLTSQPQQCYKLALYGGGFVLVSLFLYFFCPIVAKNEIKL